MEQQISLFDTGKTPLTLSNIRLIELFAGIGAQAKSLEYLGVPYESWVACEVDKYAIQSYNAIHGTFFTTTDITQLKGKDLNIVETDKHDYLLTYSFPCQDISNAGKQSGFTKGSGTRSGLLWEVERLLEECAILSRNNSEYGLPKVLIMENVPGVCGKKFKDDFDKWIEFLGSLGYESKYQIINAKNMGVPQNRARCFMVSWLGSHTYDFPEDIPLEVRLKDVLEDEVDERYYLSDEAVQGLVNQLDRPTNP